MTFGQLFIATFFSAGMGYLVYDVVPPVAGWYMKYYRKEEAACEEILGQAHVVLPVSLAFLFYSSGPLLVTVISFLLISNVIVAALLAFIFSFFLRKLGRKLSHFLYNRRLKQIKNQLMDSMGLMANALRSGMSLLQSMELAANEMPGAMSREFSQIVQETKLGSTVENALTSFKKRIPLKEVASLVDSVLILRETGGNLVETFEILIHILREEERVQGKITALTTQGIAQAAVIVLLPFGLGAALYTVSPEYIRPLIDHPIGWVIITLMLGLQALGAWSMKKIVTIEI